MSCTVWGMFEGCSCRLQVDCYIVINVQSTFMGGAGSALHHTSAIRSLGACLVPKQISEHLDSSPICRRLTMIWVREADLSLESSATNRAAHWHALHWGYFRQSSHFGALITGLKALCEPKHAVSAFNDCGRSQSTQTPRRHPWKVFIRKSTRKRSAPALPSMALFRVELDMMKQSTHGA